MKRRLIKTAVTWLGLLEMGGRNVNVLVSFNFKCNLLTGNSGPLPRKRRKQASKIKLNSSRRKKCSYNSVKLHKFLDYYSAKATLLHYIFKLTCFCNKDGKVT